MYLQRYSLVFVSFWDLLRALLKYTRSMLRQVICMDASLKGISATYGNQVYATRLLRDICEVLNIVHLEATILMACVRTARLICAENVKLQVKHARGSSNVYDDILSGWEYYQNFQITDVQHLKSCHWEPSPSPEYKTCFLILTYNVHYHLVPSIFRIQDSLVVGGKASQHVASGLLPRTSAAYTRGFHLFQAFTIYMGLQCPWVEITVLSFLEYVIQQGLSAASVSNYFGILADLFICALWLACDCVTCNKDITFS